MLVLLNIYDTVIIIVSFRRISLIQKVKLKSCLHKYFQRANYENNNNNYFTIPNLKYTEIPFWVYG